MNVHVHIQMGALLVLIYSCVIGLCSQGRLCPQKGMNFQRNSEGVLKTAIFVITCW